MGIEERLMRLEKIAAARAFGPGDPLYENLRELDEFINAQGVAPLAGSPAAAAHNLLKKENT